MRIRLAIGDDLPALMGLMRRVVPLMRAAGNLQWDETYPNEAVFQRDIGLRQPWASDAATSSAGRAAITMEPEPDDGQVAWNVTEPPVVVHPPAPAPRSP